MYYGFDNGFGMFGIMEMLFPIFFIAVVGIIVYAAIKGIGQAHKNNNSPVLSVEARVTAKRTDTSVSSHHTGVEHGHHHTTDYYVTFQVESGDRMEFNVGGREYGLLAEEDFGKLTFQGTRYRGFERATDGHGGDKS